MTALLEEKRDDEALVGVDPEALIEEARQRQRRRRRIGVLALGLAATVAVGISVATHVGGERASTSHPRPRAAGATSQTLRLRLLGWGTPQPDTLGSGPCPWGRTYIRVVNMAGDHVGDDNECVLLVSKDDVPGYGVRSTHGVVIATYTLRGGTIRVRETHDFRFARDQKHSYGRLRGTIIGGSGRYAHARGTLTGGGPGVDDSARWNVVLQVRLR